ncbi:MAG: hypothetical protein P4N60_08065, partial [Verrucomicrobiae bacterium]|nr:hypothetical protein [Verrucomicrobiae bacterium]
EQLAQRLEFDRVRAGLALRCEKPGLEEGLGSRPPRDVPASQWQPDRAELELGVPKGGCELATGKSPAPAGSKACPAPEPKRGEHRTQQFAFEPEKLAGMTPGEAKSLFLARFADDGGRGEGGQAVDCEGGGNYGGAARPEPGARPENPTKKVSICD